MFISKKILFCIFLMLSSQIVLSKDVEKSTNFDIQKNLAYQDIKAHLATIDTIYTIVVEDQVKGGCLPYPNKLKDAAEIGLRRNGFTLGTVDSIPSLPNNAYIIITVVGSKSGQQCYAHIGIQLGIFRITKVEWAKEPADIHGDGQHVNVMLYHDIASMVLIGGSDYIQSSMEYETKEAMDNLFLEVSRARDYIFANFPSIKREYERQKALYKAIKEQDAQ